MGRLLYSINVTLDGCGDHRAIPADEELHRHTAEVLAEADALVFASHGPTLFAGPSKPVDLNLVSRLELGSGAVATRYEPRW